MSERGLIDVHVERLAPGGDAVGRQQGEGQAGQAGRATFVALAAPDEEVRARLLREKPRVAWAELVEIRRSSPVRVPPPCPYFGACGGCQWQHVALEAQRDAKREIVARALGGGQRPAGGSDAGAGGARGPAPRLEAPRLDMSAPVPAGAGYRDRARFVVGAEHQLGFRSRRSAEVVDLQRCLVLAQPLNDALPALKAEARAWPHGTEVDVQLGREGLAVAVRPAGGGRALRRGPAEVDVAHGPDDGPALRVPAGAFAQVGAAANAALARVVRREVGAAPGAVLELHAGSGNFTRFLVQVSTQVTAHDGDAAAVERGRRNVAEARWLDGPPTAVERRAGPADVALVDPPREGLDAAALAAAVTARRRIVYVSCDPQTLGRDVARLAAAGFTLVRATALDLMPHTHHVETVATFER